MWRIKPQCTLFITGYIITAIAEFVWENTGLSVSRRSFELSNPQTSSRRILHKDLSVKAYKVKLKQVQQLFHTNNENIDLYETNVRTVISLEGTTEILESDTLLLFPLGPHAREGLRQQSSVHSKRKNEIRIDI